jgi:hypothetical protein
MTFETRIKMPAFFVLVLGMIATSPVNSAQASFVMLMVEVINPAANTLWNASVQSTLSEQDWDQIEQAVRTLTRASMVVSAGGDVPAQRDLTQSQEWQEWSARFTATLQAASRASNDKDRQALTAASNRLVDVCEGCHMVVAARQAGRK